MDQEQYTIRDRPDLVSGLIGRLGRWRYFCGAEDTPQEIAEVVIDLILDRVQETAPEVATDRH